MFGFKLLLGVMAIMAGLAFSGDPGDCGSINIEPVEVLPALNKVNRLIAGETKKIELTDDELMAMLAERLDPRVRRFNICLKDDQIGISGQTINRLGLTLKFNILGIDRIIYQISTYLNLRRSL